MLPLALVQKGNFLISQVTEIYGDTGEIFKVKIVTNWMYERIERKISIGIHIRFVGRVQNHRKRRLAASGASAPQASWGSSQKVNIEAVSSLL